MSLPSTPIRPQTRLGLGAFDAWGSSCEEEPAMERVESVRELREPTPSPPPHGPSPSDSRTSPPSSRPLRRVC
ncbi:hypothetical protein ACS0TY_001323 [Phlomoides rotata]